MADPLIFGERLPGKPYCSRPGAYALLSNPDGYILMMQTEGGYFLPGGGLHPLETPEEAVRREVLEECGCEIVTPIKFGETIDYFFAQRSGVYYKIHSHYFQAEVGRPTCVAQEDGSIVHWMEPAQALPLMKRPGQAWAVRRWMDGYSF